MRMNNRQRRHMTTFALIGDGAIAKYHKAAVEHVGGEIVMVFDPKYEDTSLCRDLFSDHGVSYETEFAPSIFKGIIGGPVDYFIICSPSNLHRKHILQILEFYPSAQIICEKPYKLPWETSLPELEHDLARINIAMQLNWAKELEWIETASSIHVDMVRDDDYLKSYKGDPKITGGFVTNLFIHYIHLAYKWKCGFEGKVSTSGIQERGVWDGSAWESDGTLKAHCSYTSFDHIDYQTAYNRMYDDIMIGKGMKIKDLEFVHWVTSDLSLYSKATAGGIVQIPDSIWHGSVFV